MPLRAPFPAQVAPSPVAGVTANGSSILRAFDTPVVIVRAGTKTTRSGETLPDWGSATRTAWLGRLYPTGSRENVDRRDTQIGDWTLLLPPGADVRGSDRVEANSFTFEVIGPPALRTVPRRGLHHVEAHLREFIG